MNKLPEFKPLPDLGNINDNYISAFNNGLSILECLYYLQGYVKITYDSMDSLLNDWNNFQTIVNEQLSKIASDEVKKILTGWLNDGTFENIIKQSDIWNQKLDKTGGTLTGNLLLSTNVILKALNKVGSQITVYENFYDDISKTFQYFGDLTTNFVMKSKEKPVWKSPNGDFTLLLQDDLKKINDQLKVINLNLEKLNANIEKCAFFSEVTNQ